MNTKGICQTINEGTNPTATRARCTYTFVGGTGNTFYWWILPTTNNAVPVRDDSNAPEYNLMRKTLPVVWKNVEASAYPDSSVLQVQYTDNLGITRYVSKSCGPFSLTFKTVTFAGGSSKNIPCYSTAPVTIALNNYVNTEDNGYDQGKWITRHFEWTLPQGWQTTSFQFGTFVGPSSITVIPPASAATASISVKAKANTQKSAAATLQITRNLESFSISGPRSVIYNSNVHYEVPNYPGISYSWQLPAGWSGSSNTNSIDVIAGCNSGNIVATMTGCNGSKPSQASITTSIIAPGSTLSGSDIMCASGAQFSVPNLVSGTNVTWNSSSNLSLSNASSNYCTYSANSNGEGWIEATINAPACGTSVTLPRKTIWSGAPETPTHINGFGVNGMEFGQNSIYEFNVDVPALQGVTNYQWVVGGGTILSGQGTDLISVRTTTNPNGIIKYFDVNVRVQNSCGWSSYFGRTGFIGTLIGPALVITPNPSTSETTVSLVTETNEPAQLTTDWDIDVYDSFQGLKEKETKLKTKEAKINTSGWKDGVYIVRAIIGDKVITGKLMVKH